MSSKVGAALRVMIKMKVKIEMELPIEISKDKKNFVVYSHAAFNQLVGTSAGASNAHVYKAKKIEGRNAWLLPVEQVKKREKELSARINEMIEKALFMRKILEEVDK